MQDGVEDAPGVSLVNGRMPTRFMPFSLGGRDCVGQTLAKLNLTTTLAQLYGSFTFKLAEEVPALSHIPEALHVHCLSGTCASKLSGRPCWFWHFLMMAAESVVQLNSTYCTVMSERLSACFLPEICNEMGAVMQMGGAEGVSASERTSITLSSAKGMKVHAIARVPAQ